MTLANHDVLGRWPDVAYVVLWPAGALAFTMGREVAGSHAILGWYFSLLTPLAHISYPVADTCANGVAIALNAMVYGVGFLLVGLLLRNRGLGMVSRELIVLGALVVAALMLATNLAYGCLLAPQLAHASLGTGAAVMSSVLFLSGGWFCLVWWIIWSAAVKNVTTEPALP